MSLYVQFSDATETVIVSFFACPQDPKVWPNQGSIETNDARWKTYYDSQPTNFQHVFPVPTSAK